MEESHPTPTQFAVVANEKKSPHLVPTNDEIPPSPSANERSGG